MLCLYCLQDIFSLQFGSAIHFHCCFSELGINFDHIVQKVGTCLGYLPRGVILYLKVNLINCLPFSLIFNSARVTTLVTELPPFIVFAQCFLSAEKNPFCMIY